MTTNRIEELRNELQTAYGKYAGVAAIVMLLAGKTNERAVHQINGRGDTLETQIRSISPDEFKWIAKEFPEVGKFLKQDHDRWLGHAIKIGEAYRSIVIDPPGTGLSP